MPNRAAKLSWDDADRRAPARGITRDDVVRAAIAIADEEGLDAVSIRHVAARLRTRPMSLYTYIAAKQDLLELMADAITAEVVVDEPLPNDWREALRRIALRSHATFVAHPWVLDISGRRADLGTNAIRHAEQLMGAIAPLGLDAIEAWNVAYVVNDYTLGHALRVAHASREPDVELPPFDPRAFPNLARVAVAAGRRRGQLTFEAGLEAVLDGIAARFARS